MIIIKAIAKQLKPLLTPLITRRPFGVNTPKDRKPSIDQQLHEIADNVNPNSVNEDFSEIARNYIQLEQQSFSRFAKCTKNDPQMMLMFLSTFENPSHISEHLPLLYPHIDYFQKKQLLLLLEKVLAFRPSSNPKVPHPKPLQQIQSILVIMSELYPADSLIEWLRLVPTYTGKDHYLLFLGYFAILQKMSPELKTRNQNLLIKCHHKISAVLTDESESLDGKIGILASAFQLNYGQAPLLLAAQGYKLCLLLINIEKYLYKHNQLDKKQQNKENEEQKINKIVNKIINELAVGVIEMDFVKYMKIDLMLDLWRVVYQQKQVKGIYHPLVNKLFNLLHQKDYQKSLQHLSTKELLLMLQTMEKHKINNPKTVKTLLVFLSPHLYIMDKTEFISLLKCLVTFVRQCEDYLINFRQVLEARKLQFSEQQALQINTILRRVEVLFPKQFSVTR